ncbi:MAG TPA: hypothetical protein VOA78_10805 [Candidatus Dormibacteraeota bacterium]|nr:hypothetical protein [Candidatus Dormibacteraeota bacterium]
MTSSPVPAPEEGFVILWAGENEMLHEALVEQLAQAGIPFGDRPIGEESTADILPVELKARFGFQVAVPSSKEAAGKVILERLLDQNIEQLAELPAADDGDIAATQTPSSSDGAATLRVWAGGDAHMAKFVEDSLRENEITVRAEKSGEVTAILVPPTSEARAREIIQEVTQGTPPK